MGCASGSSSVTGRNVSRPTTSSTRRDVDRRRRPSPAKHGVGEVQAGGRRGGRSGPCGVHGLVAVGVGRAGSWMYGGSGISPCSSSTSRASRSPSSVDHERVAGVGAATHDAPRRCRRRPSNVRRRRAAAAPGARAPPTCRRRGVGGSSSSTSAAPPGRGEAQAGRDHPRVVDDDEVARRAAARAVADVAVARAAPTARGRRAGGPRRAARSASGRCASGRQVVVETPPGAPEPRFRDSAPAAQPNRPGGAVASVAARRAVRPRCA